MGEGTSCSLTYRYSLATSQGTIEEKATLSLEAEKPVDIEIVYINTSAANEEGEEDLSQPALMRGLVSHSHTVRICNGPDDSLIESAWVG